MYRKPFKHRPAGISPTARIENDPIVQNDLAITPQQALDMAESGFAIGASSWRELTTEQRMDKDMEVPLERQRHVDMADMYQAQQDSYHKVKKLRNDINAGNVEIKEE